MAFGRRPCTETDVAKHLQKLVTQAGLPALRFHDLRHAAATLMLDAGVPIAVVSKLLGHSSPTTTLTIYAHILDDAKREGASRLDALFAAEA
ncbi:MAG: tyrosine-type recombinase/integrase [Candidatus Limnocylindrales bacterium]